MESERLSVNLDRESAETLRRVTAQRGITVTEATRRAISFLAYSEELRRNDARLIVDGTPVTIL